MGHNKWHYRIQYYKSQISAWSSIYAITAFLFFLTVHLIFWPVYMALYVVMLPFNVYRVIRYSYQPTTPEVASMEEFRTFSNVWIEFIYNITYRRSCVNSFGLIYQILKLIKTKTDESTYKRFTTYLKICLYILLILIWSLITGMPWLIITRSFVYATAFRYLNGYKIRELPILDRLRSRVVNSHQMLEILPILNYRIYRKDNSCWNFNPRIQTSKSILLYSKMLDDNVFGKLCYDATWQGEILFVKPKDISMHHYAIVNKGFAINNEPFLIKSNITSDPNFNPNLKCYGTIATKNSTQTITHIQLLPHKNLDFKTPDTLKGFQTDADKILLLYKTLPFSIIFHSDSTSSLNLLSLYDDLKSKGVCFSLENEAILFDSGRYTQDLSRFIELTGMTDWDLKMTKNLLLSHMCQDLSYTVKDFEFTNLPNEPLGSFIIENFL